MKRDGEQSVPYLRTRRIILRLVFIIMVVYVLYLLGLQLVDFFNHYELTETLDTRLLPTAQALLEQQQPTVITLPSESLSLELFVIPKPDEFAICVSVGNWGDNSTFPAHELFSDSLFFVNASQVFNAESNGEAILGGNNAWCGQGQLATGLHLVGFELRDSSFGAPIHFQQWAVEIK